jgi:ABC-2 type transport system ATP-binding protein
MALLELDAVSKRYGDVTAVDAVSFTVDRGEVVGFLGPNGAGKSTTMRMITQYIEPDDGAIRIDGAPLDAAGLEAKRRIGYLPENNPLYEDMLVSEYLEFITDLRGMGRGTRGVGIDEAVHGTGIADVYYRPIGELSKGYRQRVGLAQAILHRPDLLVLDEPTEGLDPNQRVEIRRLIGELGKERTVILSTHVLPEAQSVCSRLVVIHKGRLAADGPVGRLMEQARGSSRVSVEVSGRGVMEALRGLPGVSGVEQLGTRGGGQLALSVIADGGEDVRPRIFDRAKSEGWTLYELHQETRSLEDLFRELTGGEGGQE